MSDSFFSDVPGPIPFGGLESTDPLTFKVYQPDRLVLGKRMEDHLRQEELRSSDEAWLVVDKDKWTDEQLDQLHAWV